MPAFDNLPPVHIAKKRRVKEVSGLFNGKEQLVRKNLKTRGSFNGEFWAAATNVESTILKRTRIISEISLPGFDSEPAEWQKSEQLRAQRNCVSSFTAKQDSLSLSRPRRRLRESFVKLFATNRIPECIRNSDPSYSRTIKAWTVTEMPGVLF